VVRLFFLGLSLGLLSALVGAALDYLLYVRHAQQRPHHRPSIILASALLLGAMGVVALPLSLFLAGSFGPAFVMGIGVLAGFYFGFIVLISAWVMIGDE
jgi:hypothetical protein